MSTPSMAPKICFVTTGATYPFTALVEAALDAAFHGVLVAHGYTALRIQYGTARVAALSSDESFSSCGALRVSGFGFTEDLRDEVAAADLVVCHAGAGSVLDALRYQKRCVVVPNEELMDNHQEELAEELDKQGYVVRGSCGNLAAAVEAADVKNFTQFPESGSRRFVGILHEEMGLFGLD